MLIQKDMVKNHEKDKGDRHLRSYDCIKRCTYDSWTHNKYWNIRCAHACGNMLTHYRKELWNKVSDSRMDVSQYLKFYTPPER